MQYSNQKPRYCSLGGSLISAIISISCLIILIWLLWFRIPYTFGRQSPTSPPLARVRNGTYIGRHLDKFNQDVFLGMPYAQPPIGQNRFHPPRPIVNVWEHPRSAHEYGPHCIGYGDHQEQFQQSEDCLTLNVIRPAGYERRLLPVGVYIYGGGRHGGGSSDGRYNMSFLVAHAASVGLPFIGVSINYRSSLWGFIAGESVQGTRNMNLGLQDQRLALHWIQENIHAFGGDRTKVTIWGGSSGAVSVGRHLTAYGGRDDGLFRAAILQSGTPIARTSFRTVDIDDLWQQLCIAAGCDTSDDQLECLRHKPFEELNAAFNDSADASSYMMASFSIPRLDGDFVQAFGSFDIKEGRFVKVPVLSGVVSSEAATYIPSQVSTWEDFRIFLTEHSGYPPATIQQLLSFYPDTNDSRVLNPPVGSFTSKELLDRVKNVLGDIEVNAAQRLLCEQFAVSAHCYSYIFNATPAWVQDPRIGVPHGAEIAPLFQNLDGLGFEGNAFLEKSLGYYDMSRLMGTMWAGFITALDPNVGLTRTPYRWPKYDLREPRVFIFSEEDIGLSIPDTHRQAAFQYIQAHFSGSFHK
ncbi:Alpha/Beta hydrolase protein [Aspergillus flavus]|uniref:Carboxylic ester hydrolase n=1 Tax=Aspergillus flavus (strain ATCC 200026 / FGSC A1120 / IAM 13836 / NRRL 3357 / JCM 12722 / SRRC 167) TaxID=332952 RepID=A0A7U2QZ11_ASPFN|nr:hypothetical protein AFLA_001786 [Aspergillus flavus NRRL3357]QRD89442.1 Alpha/Beta hydrolase protein [Aspergillus flavus]